MLLLASTSDLVRLTAAIASDIECHASWVDLNGSTVTPGRTNTASITGTSQTTIVGSPAASTYRNLKLLSVRNNHASQGTLVTIDHTDGTNAEVLIACTLLPGETLVRNYVGKWIHYGPNASPYVLSLPFASASEMEAAAVFNKGVNPALQHRHPGHPKCWGKATVSGGTPTLQTNYNLTSITDTAQGRITFTIATDFSGTGWCCHAMIEKTNTTLTNANLRHENIELGGQAAGTVLIECGCGSPNATDQTLEDPAAWHMFGNGDHA